MGNKIDRDDHEIPADVGEEFANRHGMYFLQVSGCSKNNGVLLTTESCAFFSEIFAKLIRSDPFFLGI